MIDVVVIGGGPAGTSAAIHLAKSGRRVRLYERQKFPRPKLCGGFLSPEGWPELRFLGIDPLTLGGTPTKRVVIYSSRKTRAETRLTREALSLSREDLDLRLMQRAREVGVEVHDATAGPQPGSEAPWTVVAHGRRPVRSTRRASSYYGFQALFGGMSDVTDQVELDAVPGGYVGLAPQGAFVNVCGLLRGDIFRALGPDLDLLLQKLGARSALGDRMRTATRHTAWRSVGPVVMGLRQLSDTNTLYVGDAACVVDPFAGEGITMGLVGGRLVAEAFTCSEADRSATYERLWHRQFDQSIRLQRFICRPIASPLWQEFLVQICRRAPEVMRWLTEGTRPPIPNTLGAHG